MIKANDLTRGKLIELEGELYIVHEIHHVAKGNKRSHMQTKLRSLKSGNMIDMRFSVDDRVETPFLDTRPYEYLYREGDDYVLMDQQTFDQIHVAEDVMGEAHLYLKGNETVMCGSVNSQIVTVELPNTVELKVVDTPPVVRGATATNQSKEAVMETGLKIKVPPFIDIGETLRVDTRTGEYLERAK